MFFKILLLTVVLNAAFGSDTLAEDFIVETSGNAPFFELPCMAVGGTCARSESCPKGTKVGVKGLCPVQQDLGMECCRPKKEITCNSKGGECLSPSDFKCPRTLHIGITTDCTGNQICCVYVK